MWLLWLCPHLMDPLMCVWLSRALNTERPMLGSTFFCPSLEIMNKRSYIFILSRPCKSCSHSSPLLFRPVTAQSMPLMFAAFPGYAQTFMAELDPDSPKTKLTLMSSFSSVFLTTPDVLNNSPTSGNLMIQFSNMTLAWVCFPSLPTLVTGQN